MTSLGRPRRLIALLPLLLAGCDGGTRPDGLTADDRGETRAALAAARRRWSAAGPESYSYLYRRVCFCPSAPLVRITVREGQVGEVVAAETGEPVAGAFPTVEALFAEVQEAMDADAHEIRASYDAALGYPTSFYVDHDVQVADEEQRVETSGLRPLT